MFERQTYITEHRFPSLFQSVLLSFLHFQMLFHDIHIQSSFQNWHASTPFYLCSITSKCFILNSSSQWLSATTIPSQKVPHLTAEPSSSKTLSESHFCNTSRIWWFRERLPECLRGVSDDSKHLTVYCVKIFCN